MFGNPFGTTCIRPGCGHKNPKGADYCSNCGISLAFNRPAILEGNKWESAPDELAAFFKFKHMKSGFFTKTLWVPSGMKAWVLQDDPQRPVLLLNEGPNTTETLFQRMNNFFRSPLGEVLVVKTGSVPLSFSFDDLKSKEGLALTATVTLRVRVRVGEDDQHPDLAAFRRHFMQLPGVVTAEQLSRPDLLGRSVKDGLRLYLAARSIDEMAADTSLNQALDEHLRRCMGPLLMDLGLQLLEASDFTLRHPKFDEHHRLQGELWLLRREQGLRQQHTASLNDLYDAEEREKLRARRQQIERKQASGELDQEDADLAQALRQRELLQYERILLATTREQALRLGAADEVAQLEHEHAAKRQAREQQALGNRYLQDDEQAQWRYLQEVARVRRDSALKLETARLEQDLLLQRARAANELNRLQADFEMERAKRLSDDAEREAALRMSVEEATKTRLREGQIQDAEAAATADGIHLAREVRRMEAMRLQRLEDAAVQTKLEADAAQGRMSVLGSLIDLDHRDELNKLTRDEDRLDRQLERELKDRRERHAQKLAEQEIELRKISLTGSLPMESLALLADDPLKIDALVKMATLRAHGHMTAEQISASTQAQRPVPAAAPTLFAAAAAPLAAAAPTPQELARVIQQDERSWIRDVMADQRRQNDAFLATINKAIDGFTAVGVANAQAASAAPVPAAWPPVPAPAAHPMPHPVPHTVLHQAFVRCVACPALNPPAARFCGSCGAPQH